MDFHYICFAFNTIKNSGKLIYIYWCYKQIMNIFIRATVKIFSFSERCNFRIHSAVASWNAKLHLSPHDNILYSSTFIICITFSHCLKNNVAYIPRI